ncbi:hypothetical protein ACHAWF_015774 [Thalassiosira exigua]
MMAEAPSPGRRSAASEEEGSADLLASQSPEVARRRRVAAKAGAGIGGGAAAGGGSAGAAGGAGPRNVCRKSYAATLSRPSRDLPPADDDDDDVLSFEDDDDAPASASADRDGVGPGTRAAAAAAATGRSPGLWLRRDPAKSYARSRPAGRRRPKPGREAARRQRQGVAAAALAPAPAPAPPSSGKKTHPLIRKFERRRRRKREKAAVGGGGVGDSGGPSATFGSPAGEGKGPSPRVSASPFPLAPAAPGTAAAEAEDEAEDEDEDEAEEPSKKGSSPSSASDGASPDDPIDDDLEDDLEDDELDAPARFRRSYETKNSRNPRILKSIDSIARAQEDALRINRFVEVEDGWDESVEPLTCPPSQPGSQGGRGDEDEDDSEEAEEGTGEGGEGEGKGEGGEASEKREAEEGAEGAEEAEEVDFDGGDGCGFDVAGDDGCDGKNEGDDEDDDEDGRSRTRKDGSGSGAEEILAGDAKGSAEHRGGKDDEDAATDVEREVAATIPSTARPLGGGASDGRAGGADATDATDGREGGGEARDVRRLEAAAEAGPARCLANDAGEDDASSAFRFPGTKPAAGRKAAAAGCPDSDAGDDGSSTFRFPGTKPAAKPTAGRKPVSVRCLENDAGDDDASSTFQFPGTKPAAKPTAGRKPVSVRCLENDAGDDDASSTFQFPGTKPAAKPAELMAVREHGSDGGGDDGSSTFQFLGRKPAAEPPAESPATRKLGAGATGARKRPGRRGGGARALALAAEEGDEVSEGKEAMEVDDGDEESSTTKKRPARSSPGGEVRMDRDEDEPLDAKRAKKRKHPCPTDMALAEYEETGTVDSYFDREAAERKEEMKALALARPETRREAAGEEGVEDRADGDQAYASFRCDDEGDVMGTEKQSELLLSSSAAPEASGPGGEAELRANDGGSDGNDLSDNNKQSEPLLSSSNDDPSDVNKRSEPLLSSSSATEQPVAAAATAAPTALPPAAATAAAPPTAAPSATAVAAATTEAAESTAASADPNSSTTGNTRTAAEMILALRTEVDELGRALMCPICRSTLRSAKLLPCVHAFCSECLRDYFRPKPTLDPKAKRRRASPVKVKNECPVCKTPNRGCRAGVSAPHLDELARAYKLVAREFGFAPRVYHGGAGIVMTQLDPEEDVHARLDSEEEEEGEEDAKMPAEESGEARKKKESKVREHQEHLQVCQAVHGAFLERTESQLRQRPVGRREEVENQIKVRRFQQFAREQEAVVRADEAAFDRVRRVGGAKEMLAAVTAKFAAEAVGGKAGDDARRPRRGEPATANLKLPVLKRDGKSAGGIIPGKTKAAAAKTKEDLASSARLMDASKSKDESTGKDEISSKSEAIAENKEVTKSVIEERDSPVTSNVKPSMATDVGTEVEAPAHGSKDEPNVEGEEDEQFCTAPDAPDETQSVEYDTAREESQGTASLNVTASSPTVIHDGNTVKKADRPRRQTNVYDVERSPEFLRALGRRRGGSDHSESMSTAAGSAPVPVALQPRESVATAASGSSPIVLHDGNTVRKKRGPKSNLVHTFDSDPTPRRSGKMSPLHALQKSVALEDKAGDNASADGAAPPMLSTPVERPLPSQKEQVIAKGTIVKVQARTWPGINKPGGVARVTKVHSGNGGSNSTKYDVTYVLGGKEKHVDESFVTLHEMESLPTIEEHRLGNSRTTRSSISPLNQTRCGRQRKAADVETAPKTPSAAASIPIYNEKELEQIPADVLKWAGITPKDKRGKQAKATRGADKKEPATRVRKRVLTESNANTKSKPAKKQRTAFKTSKEREGSPEAIDQSSSNVGSLKEVIDTFSTEEAVRLADARYFSLFSLEKNASKSDKQVYHVVTSSLADKETKMLDSLCKMLKGTNVILKIAKDFNINKTQLCITAAQLPTQSSQQSSSDRSINEPINVVSKSRTLKVMRSALAGIPIITPLWVEACLKEGRIVAPSGRMCIRTLHRKQQTTHAAAGDVGEDDDKLKKPHTEHFAVAKYAAAYQKSQITKHLLGGVSVLLCGSWAGSAMLKDLKVLLQQAGANIISSGPMAIRLLTEMMSEKKSDVPKFVFLCDASLTDKSSGISDTLFKQAKNLIGRRPVLEGKGETDDLLLCVDFNWLFDSISCAIPMKADAYEPSAPRAKALATMSPATAEFIRDIEEGAAAPPSSGGGRAETPSSVDDSFEDFSRKYFGEDACGLTAASSSSPTGGAPSAPSVAIRRKSDELTKDVETRSGDSFDDNKLDSSGVGVTKDSHDDEDHGHAETTLLSQLASAVVCFIIYFVFCIVFSSVTWDPLSSASSLDPNIDPPFGIPQGVGINLMGIAVGSAFFAWRSGCKCIISGPDLLPIVFFSEAAVMVLTYVASQSGPPPCGDAGDDGYHRLLGPSGGGEDPCADVFKRRLAGGSEWIDPELISMVVPTTLVAMMIGNAITGVVFFSLGKMKNTASVIGFIPASVVAGFLTCIGYKEKYIRNIGLNYYHANDPWLGLLIAIIYGVLLYGIKHLHVVPAEKLILGFIFIPVILFYIIIGAGGISMEYLRETNWFLTQLQDGQGCVGNCPFTRTNFWQTLQVAYGSGHLVAWGAIPRCVPIFIMGSCMTSLDSMLKLTSSEKALGIDLDYNHEMQLGGKATVVSALFAGAPAYGQTKFNVINLSIARTAESSVPTLALGTICMLVFLSGVAGPIINIMPRFLLGGLCVFAGVGFLYENLWEGRKNMNRVSFAIVWVIFLVNFIWEFFVLQNLPKDIQPMVPGLLVVFILGIVLSTFEFMFAFMHKAKPPVIKGGEECCSSAIRSEKHDNQLAVMSPWFQVFSVESFVFFGTANNLYQQLKAHLAHQKRTKPKAERTKYLIFDLTEVTGVDSSAKNVFFKVHRLLKNEKINLVWAMSTPKLVKKFDSWGLFAGSTVHHFTSLDLALRHVEDLLLCRAAKMSDKWLVNDTVRRIFERQVLINVFNISVRSNEKSFSSARLQPWSERVKISKGEELCGPEDDNLYMLYKGEVQIRGRDGKLYPVFTGSFFNLDRLLISIGALPGLPSTLGAVATEESMVLIVPRKNFVAMQKQDPAMAQKLLVTLIVQKESNRPGKQRVRDLREVAASIDELDIDQSRRGGERTMASRLEDGNDYKINLTEAQNQSFSHVYDLILKSCPDSDEEEIPMDHFATYVSMEAQALGSQIEHEQFMAMIDASGIDEDGDGTLSREEFLCFLRGLFLSGIPSKELPTLRDAYDAAVAESPDEPMDESRTQALFDSLGFDITSMGWQDCVGVIDADGDGDVDFDEFLTGIGMMKKFRLLSKKLDHAFKDYKNQSLACRQTARAHGESPQDTGGFNRPKRSLMIGMSTKKLTVLDDESVETEGVELNASDLEHFLSIPRECAEEMVFLADQDDVEVIVVQEGEGDEEVKADRTIDREEFQQLIRAWS